MDITSFLSLSGVIQAPQAVTEKAARKLLAETLTELGNKKAGAQLAASTPQALGGGEEAVHLFTLVEPSLPRVVALCARFGAPVEMGNRLISDIAFVLAAPQTDTAYIKALGIFSQALRERGRVEALRHTASPEAMYRLLIRAVQESRA